MWHQESIPDAEIRFQGVTEYPIATLTNGANRAQVIAVNGGWIPVILEPRGVAYRKFVNPPTEVQAVVDWCYGEVAPPADVVGEEREP